MRTALTRAGSPRSYAVGPPKRSTGTPEGPCGSLMLCAVRYPLASAAAMAAFTASVTAPTPPKMVTSTTSAAAASR